MLFINNICLNQQLCTLNYFFIYFSCLFFDDP